jgi:broad specificity phosphatase PhoE
VTRIYVVQHAEKRRDGSNPGLTDAGHDQARRTGRWLSCRGIAAVYTSPLRRARETADAVASACGLEARIDDRLRERMNWDGRQPYREFLEDWVRATTDRDFIPGVGDSSRQAAHRLHQFIQEQAGGGAPIAVVSHGGITVDLLRGLLGDGAVPAGLMDRGVPPCAITTFDDLDVIDIARVDHLESRSATT